MIASSAMRLSPLEALVQAHPGAHVMRVSSAQRRFWVLDQLDASATAYTIPLALRIGGPLDTTALEAALNAIVARHESLRTVFALDGEEPVQVILPALTLTLTMLDVSALAPAARSARVSRLVAAAANAPFDLARGPLLRASLVRLSAEAHVLLVTLHHIVADGTSIGIFYRELEAGYTAFAARRAPELPPLALQYPDYAVWQEKMLAGKNALQQLSFWKEQLRGPLPLLELPTDRPRPAVQTTRGTKREIVLPADLVAAMRALGRHEGATPFAVFLAAFAALLHRYTGQDDLVVGSITAGRTRPELEPLIGLFLNTLALRVNASSDPTFVDLLARVRDVATAAVSHQGVPFEVIAESLGAVHDRSRTPVFQVAFQLLDAVATELRLPGLVVEALPTTKETAKFDLTLLLNVAPGGGLRAVIEYSTDLFDAPTIDRMLAQYRTVLEAIARDPRERVSHLTLMPPAEYTTVVERWNRTEAPYPADRCVHELFAAQAARTPDAIAVLCDGAALTYAELEARSDAFARHLGRAGVGPGTLVGICLPRSLDMVVSLLGILKAGGAYLPLDPDYPADRLAFIVRDSGVSLVITAPEVEHALATATVRRLHVDDVTAGTAATDGTPVPVTASATPESLAYVIYTSGSTGRPKGVEIEHRNVVNFLTGMQHLVPLDPEATLVAITPLSFDIAALELLLPLVTGARVVVASRAEATDARALAALLDRVGATHLQATPSTWRLLVEAGWPGRAGMKALCGGEALPQVLADALLARGLDLWNLYGPTEATIWATTDHPATVGVPVRIGRPMPNVRAYVLDASRQPAPIGVPGELWLGGLGLARGYRGQPELTRERFLPDPFAAVDGGRMYRTGDRARWHPDGSLEYLGRTDYQIKLRGHRIELGEIEAVLVQHPGVAAAVAMVREDTPGNAQLVAYVIAGEPSAPTVAALRESVRQRLPEVMVPAAIVFLDRFPTTPNGKVDRNALAAPAADARDVAAYVAPATMVETAIAAAWALVFGMARVGRHDDFFDLGGHSLLAMRLLGLMQQRVAGADLLTIRTILQERTVARVAAAIAGADGGAAEVTGRRAITKHPRGGPAPLSPAQKLVWLYEQMLPGLATYHVPMARRVRGTLDVDALQRALDALVVRHEILRSRIVEIDGEPMQVAAQPGGVPLAVTDLRNAGAAGAREAEGWRILRAQAARPFDLPGGQLFRAALVRLDDRDALLLFEAHHIAFDGASVGVLARDLGALYAAAVAGRDDALAPLPIQFADYARWEEEALAGPRFERALEYWRKQLDGAPTSIDLATDHPRSAAAARGARHTASFPRLLADAVQRTARAHDATPFMVLLAAFQLLLHRYGGQEDVVVGAPIAGRVHPETTDLIGYFASTLALRTRFEDDPSFVGLLARVRATCLDAYEHQEVPLETLLLERQHERPAGQSGLFSVMFVLQDGAAPRLRLGNAEVEPVPMDLGVSKFDLSLSVAETPDGLRVSAEYRADLFEAATVERMLANFEVLLGGALASPETPVSRIPLLTATEREQVLVRWNDTAVAYPQDETLVDLLEQQLRHTPDSIAVSDGADAITFKALHARAEILGHWLRAQGAGPGALVAVCVDRSIDLVVALLAVLKAGAAYVPLDPDYPAERLAFMLSDANPRVLLTQARLLASIPGHGGVTLAIDRDWPSAAPSPSVGVPARATPSDPAYMIYTSGSTGRPKGALNSHRGIVNRLRWMQSAYQLDASDAVLQKTPASFDVSVWEFFLPLATGARLVMAMPGGHRDPGYIASTIENAGITVVHFVPSMLAAFVEVADVGRQCRSLRDVICSGETLRTDLARQFRAAIPTARLHNLYGPTEAAIDVSFFECRGDELPPSVPIGRPVANTRLYVLDRHLAPVPIGVPGELYIAGTQVGMGYHGRASLTAERFPVDPFVATSINTRSLPRGHGARMYRTGDRARWQSDGALEFLGRLDSQVKLRGQRIELAEIEIVLREQTGVAAAAVIVREDAAGDARLVGYFVPSSGVTPAIPELLAGLRRVLPPGMVPGALVRLDALPLTPSGKLDRQALPPPDRLTDEEHGKLVAPRTPVEQAVAAIWADILHRNSVGVDQDFIALGGHSLLAAQVAGRLAKLFRTPIPLRRFFERPTVEGLAAELIAAEPKPGQATAIAAALLQLRAMSPEERRDRRDAATPARSTP